MLELFHNAFLLINNINKTDESTNNLRVQVIKLNEHFITITVYF